MKIDVSDIKHQKAAEKNVTLCAPIKIDDYWADLTLTGKAVNLGEYFMISGTLEGVVHTCCAKCLKETDISYEEDITIPLAREGADLQDNAVLEEALFFSGDTVCLEATAAAMIRADMPIAVYCADDCKGLCSVCGINLNNYTCSCEVNRANTKLSELKNMFIE